MNQSGMSLLNVIGVTPSRDSLSALVAEPAVQSVVYFTFGVATQGYAGLHGNIAYIAPDAPQTPDAPLKPTTPTPPNTWALGNLLSF